jgi:CDGSH-type Zn-finger protein/uncharacterized Fe-S cluster protein YjdI
VQRIYEERHRVEEKILIYSGKDIEVSYDVNRCIHAGECVRGLSAVFDPKAKPWIKPDGAPADEVAEVISRCPTGALQYTRLDGQPGETVPRENSITVAADGPLYCRGQVRILDGGGNQLLESTRIALCRCGASKNKPYCDGSHDGIAFEDDGNVSDPTSVALEENEGVSLEVSCFDNGPFGVSGKLKMVDAFGDTAAQGNSTYLCRCGGSSNKPFCDGTHKRIGFVSSG